METVTSKDGTTIAYDKAGSGPALILVGGAFEQRAMESDTSYLAAYQPVLDCFTVYHYDRRGRGDSGDTQPYALEREIEDIEALIDLAGGSAYLSGISSGAALAFEAALALPRKVKKLAMYEPPYNDDAEGRKAWVQYRKDLNDIKANGKPGDAVGRFMMLVGMPPEQVEGMRQIPMWPMFEAVEATLAYDAAALGDEAAVPVEKAARLTIPTLVMNGSATPYPFMAVSAAALAKVLPNGQQRTLEGQVHEVEASAIGPVLIEFFSADN